jgi:hypothetical protein
MNFGEALQCLKAGLSVKRKDWGGYWTIEEWEKVDVGSIPFIVAYLKDGGFAPAQAYQNDILAEDWELIG